MVKIPTSKIDVDRTKSDTKRFRKDFGNIQQLADSIKRFGLIHPIVVDNAPNDRYILVAGERRLTATLMNGSTEIEATLKSELTPLERKLIELEENIQRKDINWEEQVIATGQLHALKQQEHGAKLMGQRNEKGWSAGDTAEFLGASTGTISQDIQLAKDLEDPEIREKIRGMGKFEARKAVEREKRARRISVQLEKKEISLSTNLKLGNFQDRILEIPSASIDCIITDPPWGIDAIIDVSNGNLSGKYKGETNAGTAIEMHDIFITLCKEMSRVLIPGGHFYMFFGPQWYSFFQEHLEKNDILMHPVPLIWHKHRTTMIPHPYHYTPSYEMILFGCKKPQKRTLTKPTPNLFNDFPAVAPAKRVHSFQKPQALISLMIENSTCVGETVLDPFAGSGITLKAARELGRKSIGFENDEGNFYAAQEFLNEDVKGE